MKSPSSSPPDSWKGVLGGVLEPGWKDICQLVRVFGFKFAASLLPGGGRGRGGGQGEGPQDGCLPSALPAPAQGSPPPDRSLSTEGFAEGAAAQTAGLEAQCRTAGSGQAEPVSRVFERTGCGLLGAGDMFLLYWVCASLGYRSMGFGRRRPGRGKRTGQLLQLSG